MLLPYVLCYRISLHHSTGFRYIVFAKPLYFFARYSSHLGIVASKAFPLLQPLAFRNHYDETSQVQAYQMSNHLVPGH
jgi:hypothetical protein